MCFSYTTRARPQITWDCGAMNINFAERGLKSRTTPGSTWCNNPFAPPESFLFFGFFCILCGEIVTPKLHRLSGPSQLHAHASTHTLSQNDPHRFSQLGSPLSQVWGAGCRSSAWLSAGSSLKSRPFISRVWKPAKSDCRGWWLMMCVTKIFFFFFFNLRGFQTVTCCYIFVSGKPASLRKPAKSCSW